MNIKPSNIFIFCLSFIMVSTVLLISAPSANADALSDYLATHIIGLWPDDRIPVMYTIDNTFSDPEKQAIRNAFKTWQAANSRMEFKEKPYKSQTLLDDPRLVTDPSKMSRVVLVTRKPLEEIPQYYLLNKKQGLGSSCPSAQAFPQPWGPNNQIRQIYGGSIILVPEPKTKDKLFKKDICISRKWTTAKSKISNPFVLDLDLETAMLHEIGHLIGLNHPDEKDMGKPTIMGSVASSKIHRELYPADIDEIRRVYPKTNKKPTAAAAIDKDFKLFMKSFKKAVQTNDRAAIRNMMSTQFQWACDPLTTREKALQNMDQMQEWETLKSALTKEPVTFDEIKDSTCNKGVCYGVFHQEIPVGFIFKKVSGQWKWVEFRAD